MAGVCWSGRLENGKPGEKRVQQESRGRVKVRTTQEKNVPSLQNQNRKGRPLEPSWRIKVAPSALRIGQWRDSVAAVRFCLRRDQRQRTICQTHGDNNR